MKITFGPVPSRRLGRSLGINNIPAKYCSYACIYCQLGNTLKMQVQRQAFYKPEDIFKRAENHIEQIRRQKEKIDYLALVPDGEPTLDINLGYTIELLKSFDVPIAVITNASLIADEQVRSDLTKADWVSLKLDTVDERIWRQIDRPHGSLDLQAILEGMLQFRDIFKGELATETMLIKGINDVPELSRPTARFLKNLKPQITYLSIPTRPPAERHILPAAPQQVNQVYQIFSENIERVELLTGYEGNTFSGIGNIQSDILSITSVHPMRREALNIMIKREGSSDDVLDQLLKSGALIETDFSGHKYYLRNFGKLNPS